MIINSLFDSKAAVCDKQGAIVGYIYPEKGLWIAEREGKRIGAAHDREKAQDLVLSNPQPQNQIPLW